LERKLEDYKKGARVHQKRATHVQKASEGGEGKKRGVRAGKKKEEGFQGSSRALEKRKETRGVSDLIETFASLQIDWMSTVTVKKEGLLPAASGPKGGEGKIP